MNSEKKDVLATSIYYHTYRKKLLGKVCGEDLGFETGFYL